MSVIKKWLFAICAIILMNGCAPLRMPVIVRNAPIEMYKYAYISPHKGIDIKHRRYIWWVQIR